MLIGDSGQPKLTGIRGGGGARPSLNTIARLAHCDKRTVKDAIARMTDLGFLHHPPPRKNGHKSKTTS